MHDVQALSMPDAQAAFEECASADHRASACHSRRSSGQSTEASTTSLTFSSAKRHSRGPSSTSSLSSSPPRHDNWDSHSHKRTAPSPALPYVAEVAEDPTDHYTAFTRRDPSLDGFAHWSRRAVSNQSSVDTFPQSPRNFTDPPDGFHSDSELAWEHHAKRRRSGDYGFNDFAARIVTRFPAFSKRSRERKRASLPTTPFFRDGSEPVSPTSPASPRRARSRSSSRARSLFRRSGEMETDRDVLEQQQQEFPSQIETIAEDEPLAEENVENLGMLDEIVDAPAFGSLQEAGAEAHHELASPEELRRVSTPLLPALMAQSTSQPEPQQLPDASQSPIYSPSPVRDGVVSSRTSLIGTPQLASRNSPALSKPSSVASFHQRQRTMTGPSSDVPPMVITDLNDEWTERLGHANFHIYPAPYRATEATLEACEQLLGDWEEARQAYSKHLGRTNTHFGPTSQTYQLTEQKWAGIDLQWKRNYESAKAEAAKHGQVVVSETPVEPAPVAKMPPMNDLRSEGKFPGLGDADIVGPMTQVASPLAATGGGLRRRPSKKAKILKMFGFMTPSTAMNRV